MSDGAGTRSFTARPAGPADAEVLVGIFNRAFRKHKDRRTLEWKYFDGPHGPALAYLAIGTPENRPGGAYSYVLRDATCDGRPFRLAQASDAMVDEEFRRRGIFTGLDDRAAHDAAAAGVPVCFATAGRQSMHGFLKNGWEEIGMWRNYAAVFDPAALAPRRLPRALARALAPLAGAALFATGRAPRRTRRPPAGLDVARLERFDASATALWERVRDALPIAGVRDAAWLNWRYVDTPSRRHRCYGVTRGGALVAYVVVEDGGGLGFVVDVLGADDAAEDAALQAGLADLRGRGVAVAEAGAPPCPRLIALFRRNGMFPYPRPRPFRHVTPLIVRVLREDSFPAPPVLRDPRRWYALDGDRDVEHMAPIA